jgi:hypothetical protein
MIILIVVVLLTGSELTDKDGFRHTDGRYAKFGTTYETIAECESARSGVIREAKQAAEIAFVSKCATKNDTLEMSMFSDNTKPLPAEPTAAKKESF